MIYSENFWISLCFADFKTLCFVQVNVIDINDQIPVFEKSDVSSCHHLFFLTLFILHDPNFWDKNHRQ
jgi:hypothetical protein